MRRTMQALLVTAVLASSASAQGDGSQAGGCAPCGSAQPTMAGCGNGTGSQLAAYMNSFPTHPNLWESYPNQYEQRLDCLYRHVNGCNCLDPKRNLHAHPSVIPLRRHVDCESPNCATGCSQDATPAQAHEEVKPLESAGGSILNTKPSTVKPYESILKTFGKTKPAAKPVEVARKPPETQVKVTPLVGYHPGMQTPSQGVVVVGSTGYKR